MATAVENQVKTTRVKVSILLSILALVLALVIATLNLPSQSRVESGPFGAVGYPTNLNGIANSCGSTYRWTPNTRYYGIIPNNFYKRYSKTQLPVPQASMVLPVYGYMSRDIPNRSAIHFYSAKNNPNYQPWQILRIMYEYDTVVVWYLPTTDPTSIAMIEHYTKTHANVLALPWTYSDRMVPGKPYGFAAWGVEQFCKTYDTNMNDDFINFIKMHHVNRPNTAPVAKMTKYGVLPILTQPSGN